MRNAQYISKFRRTLIGTFLVKDPSENILADVYDARVWKEFTTDKYKNYFKNPGNLLLSLNFSHLFIQIILLELCTWELRYKIENIILVGIIPGPKEPHLILNSYITPLVQELTKDG